MEMNYRRPRFGRYQGRRTDLPGRPRKKRRAQNILPLYWHGEIGGVSFSEEMLRVNDNATVPSGATGKNSGSGLLPEFKVELLFGILFLPFFRALFLQRFGWFFFRFFSGIL